MVEFNLEFTIPNTNQTGESTSKFSNIYFGGGFNPFENLSINLELGVLLPKEEEDKDASWATGMISLSVPFTLF